ncbi:hypothetical protein PPERSA_11390 [Pseudocohnilembus persalinus]|uniref:Uncharacterized protein n=1 Tax=Pseudocohnilembus persalinus TaxID=266149 RepID=A0A0V0QQF7_PSEPJ|nr:hypothetical protein PPERSA_11390 [Pseudocohnilembus persalinus]|eukprot:KRX04266.1 hypothetical protein PPERSA_11390 [Pseudocohnilembus persalinus]
MSQENQQNQIQDNPIIQSQNNPLKDLIKELKPSNSATQTQNNCINLSNSNLSIEPKHNSQNEHLQYQGQILTFQKTRNQIKGIQPSKKLTGKGAVKDMRQMLQEKDKFNPNLHRNYRKYQELEYTVELCSRFEWWEKLQTSNRQIPSKCDQTYDWASILVFIMCIVLPQKFNLLRY